MQKMSVRKLSMLGLVLMAASAVTAAIIPSRSKDANSKFSPGSLTASSATQLGVSGATCTVDNDGIQNACNITASGTTENSIPNSTNVNGSISSDHP